MWIKFKYEDILLVRNVTMRLFKIRIMYGKRKFCPRVKWLEFPKTDKKKMKVKLGCLSTLQKVHESQKVCREWS